MYGVQALGESSAALVDQPMSNRVTVFTDGASRGNPGSAAFGCWITVAGRLSWGLGHYLGTGITNNVAEYHGLVRGLELALDALAAYDVERANVYTDSDLVVRQLSGEFACNDEKLVPLLDRARALMGSAPKPLSVAHVLRESNTLADAMANRALDECISVTTAPPTFIFETHDTARLQNVPPRVRPVKRRKA
jgi:ribonuclease HI